MAGKKPRISVQDIAEILVQRIEKVEQSAERIEVATSKPVKVDLTEFKQLVSQVIQMQKKTTEENKRILSVLSDLKKKERTKLPNYVIVALIVLFCTFIGTSIYFGKKHQDYTEIKSQMKFYRNELLKKNKK